MSDEKGAIRFIGRRVNSPGGMPRSIRAMRAVAAVGIAIAVAALIIAVSIGRGFEKVYTRALLDFNAHVVVMGAGEIDNPDELVSSLRSFEFASNEQRMLAEREGWLAPWIDKIRTSLDGASLSRFVPNRIRDAAADIDEAARRGVIAATPFLYREGLIMGGGGIRGVVIKGIDPATLSQVSGMRISLYDSGRSIEQALKGGQSSEIPAIVGEALARDMGLGGDVRSVRLMVAREGKDKSFAHEFVKVNAVGTFASGMHDYDSQFMLMSLPDARSVFGAPKETVTGIELKLYDPVMARLVAEAIDEKLGPVYRAITWDELNSDLLAAVRLEKFVSALIMSIMLMVAALNIVATLVLMTIYRMHEIAILKALGLSDRAVTKIFVMGGMKIGLWGILAGLAVGIGIAAVVGRLNLVPLEAEIYLVASLPIDISWPICGLLALFCAVVIFMTSRLAAKKLAGVTPAEGLAQAR